MADSLPIYELIERRRVALRLGRYELALRCGFKNTTKGIRRIDAICRGEFVGQGVGRVLVALPAALDIEATVLAAAIIASNAVLEARADAEAAEEERQWRAAFTPHGWLLGERKLMNSFTVYAMTGGPDRWLGFALDASNPPVTFAQQGVAALSRNPHDPFHGRHIGFVINYTPDAAVKFSADGIPVERLNRAYAPGRASWGVKGRRLPAVAHCLERLA